MEPKIQGHHLEKRAYIYLRQSTMGQVRHHRESTERQYALKERALTLGWNADKITVFDGDLGLSGADSGAREDFKTVVADVSMNRVGAVFALEASRLSRSNTDWHRLLELCSFTGTLIIDDDGCYDPSQFNDQLLLGLKGTMSQAELHFLRARLQGGKLNKAKKGELRTPLPVGFVYDLDGHVEFDSDEQVRAAIELIFEAFRATGSAYGVVLYFARQGVLFPKRAYGGAWDGKLLWGAVTYSRVLEVLKNPSYAGVYVYGRYGYRKKLTEEGRIQRAVTRKPMGSWEIVIKNHHPGYISWDDYEANQKALKSNQTNAVVVPGVVREGLALLQGLLLCGRCGRRLTTRYTGNGGLYPVYQCVWKQRDAVSSRCMSLRCNLVDEPVGKRVLEAVQPAQIELALKAYEEVEQRSNALERQWLLKLERADYEAQLAQRRYEEVDPSNRLVAATLERRWNEALERLDEVRKEYADSKSKQEQAMCSKHKEEVLALGEDFPRLWKSSTTKPRDRKRILRLLIRDVTVEREEGELVLHVRWQGGAVENLTVPIPLSARDKWRYGAETVARVRQLAQELRDREIAQALNREGVRPSKGSAFTSSSVAWIRYKHGIAAPSLKRAHELTVREVAEKFRVSKQVVHYWIGRKLVQARKSSSGFPCWITLDQATEERLQSWADDSPRIAKVRRSQSIVEGGAV